MPAGRPAHYDTPDSLQIAIDAYFEGIKGEFHFEADESDEAKDIKVWDKSPEPATITGLCLSLGFESRQSFHDYAKNLEFSYTIKKARLRVENAYEIALNYSRLPTAQIFALKNLGWEDKSTIAGDPENPLTAVVPIVNVYNNAPPLHENETDADA